MDKHQGLKYARRGGRNLQKLFGDQFNATGLDYEYNVGRKRARKLTKWYGVLLKGETKLWNTEGALEG